MKISDGNSGKKKEQTFSKLLEFKKSRSGSQFEYVSTERIFKK